MKHAKFYCYSLSILLGLLIAACGGYGNNKQHVESQEKLARNIKVFNTNFESRTEGASALLVKADLRDNYVLKLPDIKDKVNFSDSSIIKMEYSRNGAPIKLSGGLPTEDFDECTVTMRYRLTIMPSTKLETRIVKQRWVQEEGDWVVIPDLSSFLK